MANATDKPLAVVTGASSGIGLELARQCVTNGFDVFLIADDAKVTEVADELRDKGATTYARQIDLATYEGVEDAWREIVETRRPVDALLLNAGVGVAGDFVRETSLDRELRMVALNCDSVVHLAKRVLPGMVARKKGRVLITSSVVALMPGSGTSVYGATKAFDLGFAEALRDELRDTGVTVTALQPGPTETQFFRRAGMEHTRVGQQRKDDAAIVARQGFDAMMRGKHKIYGGSLKTRVMGVLSEFLPEPIKARTHGKMTEPV
ncbi:SDR family NAD(P)-dependent oxidoreductase [Sandaracinus amylolyticus]|uniref:SDR family NAD(P)-dependent oxidoreductase n=1 Tax=Sandaracinus amylolyticus TaxID=927083 RepID=UPI001F19BBDE|nr:SDR family NAD(P)-dependent oxidoreductase [Sandaracinus amylolyticus]UJR81880.1 Short-subunit dehydrogenase [Sandaracinus amylolyticus]